MSFPAELKSLRAVAARADELEAIEPAIAYWSRYHIVQKAVAQKLRSPEVDNYLGAVLDKLEAMRKKHQGLADIEDDTAGKAKVTSFALKVFDNADREEKAAQATKATAAKFLAAAGFLEVCGCFGEVDKELADKRKYAKVQAMRIQAAYAAGQDPNKQRKAAAMALEEQAPTAAEQAELDALLDNASSAQPREGVNGTVHSKSQELVPDRTEINPYFPDIEDEINERPPVQSSAKQSPFLRPSSPPTELNLPVQDPTFESMQDVFVKPAAEYPLPNLEPMTLAAIASKPTEPVDQPKQVVTDEDIARAQKHAKFALSALNFEDVETAISEFKKAISVLGG
jgi:vacuolar protein sorting-associated protein VTA1